VRMRFDTAAIDDNGFHVAAVHDFTIF